VTRQIGYLQDAIGMSDRERILTFLAMVCGPFTKYVHGEPGPHDWTCWSSAVRPGDLVRCTTQRVPNHWNVAWYVGPSERGHGTHLLREFGGERLCHMGNESLYSLRGQEGSPYLLEGHQWRAHVAVERAFAGIDHYEAKLAGVRFPDRHARSGEIIVRPHIFSSAKGATEATLAVVVPFTFTARASGKAVRAAVMEALRDVDWSTRVVPRERPDRWLVVPPAAWDPRPARGLGTVVVVP
jgi:hypothetical protein